MAEAASDHEGARRCGFVTLIGAPNVGKSTLLNALVGSKVSIVTPKVQTTRTLVRGIVVVDTPGIFAPRRRLDRAMVATAWGGAHDADIVGVLVDAKCGLDANAAPLFNRIADVGAPKILLINKVDLIDKQSLLSLAGSLNDQSAFAATFMISALSGDGVGDVRAWLAEHVPEGPWHYPEDQISDAPLRSLAAEITREKLYLLLHQELPYQSTVETEVWKELKDGAARIEQTIYVARESQRKIVLGKGGQTIKRIGADARKEMADIPSAPCTSSCSSRCERDGRTIPSATVRWDWNFPGIDLQSFFRGCLPPDGMDRRRYRARHAQARGGQCNPRADDARARAPSRPGQGRGRLAAAAGAAARQFRRRDVARADRRASRALSGRGAHLACGGVALLRARGLRNHLSRRALSVVAGA